MQTHTKPTNQINYYGPHNNPNNTLNGYPRTLITALTQPDYRQKEQCILITQERLTHPTNTIQNVQQYTEIHQAEHHNKKPNPNDILKLAKTDPDLTPPQLTQIKHTLAQQITQKNEAKKGVNP